MIKYRLQKKNKLQKTRFYNGRKKNLFGVKWKEAREKAGLTQAQVAEALGYKSGQFISNVEAGRCRFPGEQLGKIRNLYGLKMSALLDLVMAEEEEVIRKGLDGE